MEDDFSVQVPDTLEEILKSSRPPRFAGQICREILNEIRSLSFLIEDEESIWDDQQPKLKSSTKTESSIPLLPSSKESNKRKSNIKCNPLTVRKKRKTAKEKRNSASTIDVLMPQYTKMIIEEIPDLILDENFNESASEEFDSKSSTELKLNLSYEEIDRIINQRSLNDTVIRYFQQIGQKC